MSLHIIKAGLLDTIQDMGRWSYQHLGVITGGAMDRCAAQTANALLGKELTAPVIEMHFPAPVIVFETATIICLTGADFSPAIDGQTIPLYQPVVVAKGTQLTCSRMKKGARCYLSIIHNLKLNQWLGSYSMAGKIGLEGIGGRPLEKGDRLSFADSLPIETLFQGASFLPLPWKAKAEAYSNNQIRFTIGSEWKALSVQAQTTLLNTSYTITPQSDRMGYRLLSEPLTMKKPLQLISSAVSFGTIQLLPDGQLIILMADHQTTGGYPKIGHIISAHLPLLAQVKPNEAIRLVLTTQAEAEQWLLEQQQYIRQLRTASTFKIEELIYAHH
jgi:antagonist of KipI